MEEQAQSRRSTDGGWLCWIAKRLSEAWDFVDKRDIDKHALAWLTAVSGWDLTLDMSDFAREALAAKVPMSEVALAIGAMTAPYALFAGAVVKWYFERQKD